MSPDEITQKEYISSEKSLAYQTRGTFRIFEKLIIQRLSKTKIPISQFHILRVLWENDGLRQNEISEAALITDSSTAQVLNMMEKASLIRRDRSKKDRRAMYVYLTDKGKSLKNDLLDIAHSVLKDAAKGISKKDITTYMKVSKALRYNLLEAHKKNAKKHID